MKSSVFLTLSYVLILLFLFGVISIIASMPALCDASLVYTIDSFSKRVCAAIRLSVFVFFIFMPLMLVLLRRMINR